MGHLSRQGLPGRQSVREKDNGEVEGSPSKEKE